MVRIPVNVHLLLSVLPDLAEILLGDRRIRANLCQFDVELVDPFLQISELFFLVVFLVREVIYSR